VDRGDGVWVCLYPSLEQFVDTEIGQLSAWAGESL
jgi:hypothetical protein